MRDTGGNDSAPEAVEAFIARWQGQEGGQERANYGMFLRELCDILGVGPPDPAGATTEFNDYVFERAVKRSDNSGYGRIDLYKRGCFLLEAKQSRWLGGKKEIEGQEALFPPEPHRPGRGQRGATRGWDVLMKNARQQAEDYARALPVDHDWPPFILVCDVGHCIELYADFSGKGRNYKQFPDRQGFRVYLEDLRDADIRDRLRLIWTDPHALDATRQSAKVTREIAKRLAAVSKAMEAKGYNAEDVAEFLMRCVFTMFAEDARLLPEKSFVGMLGQCEADPKRFVPEMELLWRAMNAGDYSPAIGKKLLKFNGDLFARAKAFPLGREEIGELKAAAGANWREVEPAIFGTLLEQALNPKERKRLGAHYTPRAYVEQLVVATIIEPLREHWRDVQAAAEKLVAEKDGRVKAARVIKVFHDALCAARVLDPACGTGNFLYVALELLKRLEGEVLEAYADLGGQEALKALEGHTVDPHQFLGLELNPRAAKIAELVLWIGYLQWHFRTRGAPPSEPILRAFKNIRYAEAVLTWDGWPVPKIVDGEETYPNARRPEWPQAEFIVGNPPFIGKGGLMRAALGDEYTEALWSAHSDVSKSSDYVLYWWDRAAEILTRKGTQLRRFGLVTTNSITQVFNRRVLEKHLSAKQPVSLVMAIPDHPWTKATKDAAAVRIAMTVGEAGKREGVLREVVREAALDTDEPQLETTETVGYINSDLTVGPDLTSVAPLRANEGVSCNGMMLAGRGFVLTSSEAEHLIEKDGVAAHHFIRRFLNGGDLVRVARPKFVIDFFGLSSEEARQRSPRTYQHVLEHVKPERDFNRRAAFRNRWWVFGEPRRTFRPALGNTGRYVATTETAKHRIFQFLSTEILPDHMIIAIALADAFHLGVLSSRIHAIWALRAGGWLGVGNDPRYSKSRCFDPFPFPDPVPDDLKEQIRALAEELDATRKRVLEDHPDLALTGLYNVLEKLRDGTPVQALREKDRDICERGLVLILKELHERIDALVARAYGWPTDLSEEAILERLVALNQERAREERRGKVRWLRPDYQIPRFGTPKEKEEQIEAELVVREAAAKKPALPSGEVERTAAIFAMLRSVSDPIDAAALAQRFSQGKKVAPQVRTTLAALARLGYVASPDGERYVLPR